MGIMYYVCVPFGIVMKWCWQLVSNYGLAILLFTLATKIILLPVSVWIQKNSILMVKIQPEVNFLKARLSGNMDAIADEQAKLFKRENYHPLLALVPLLLQVFLLLAVIEIIYHPMTYLIGVDQNTIDLIASHLSLDVANSGCQISIIEAVKNGTLTASTAIAGLDPNALAEVVSFASGFDMKFLGTNLSLIPSEVWGLYILVPVVAALSSWVMCWTQNKSNVIQAEQGKLNKYFMMVVSVGLSLYLGLFVPAGIALYWTLSNLMSVGQMYLLNVAINPKKYVDYEALEQSRIALAESKAFGQIDKKDPLYKQMKKREKEDYKAFKRIANKHIVVYSEKSGFYKYYKDLLNELIKRSNVIIHYVTNDYNDQIFEVAKTQPRIKPYYISLKKTPLLMMLVETDMFLMTTPDLDKYYLKRSFVKKDAEYVYVPHDTMSAHMGFNEGAFDAFDTMLCASPHFAKEIREIENIYKLKQKNLVEFGFPLLDELVEKAREENKNKTPNAKKQILIAPSWQEDNILDSVIDDLIKNLCCDEYHVIVRPHPEYAKRYKYQLNELVERYKDFDPSQLSFELDFSVNKSIYSADLMITDWSGISAEYCFATQRPAVFINTKIKACNDNWQKIGITPVEIALRNQIGVDVDKDKVCDIKSIVKDLIENGEKYKQKIDDYFETFTFNHGTAAVKGAQYILKSLVEKKKNKKD